MPTRAGSGPYHEFVGKPVKHRKPGVGEEPLALLELPHGPFGGGAKFLGAGAARPERFVRGIPEPLELWDDFLELERVQPSRFRRERRQLHPLPRHLRPGTDAIAKLGGRIRRQPGQRETHHHVERLGVVHGVPRTPQRIARLLEELRRLHETRYHRRRAIDLAVEALPALLQLVRPLRRGIRVRLRLLRLLRRRLRWLGLRVRLPLQHLAVVLLLLAPPRHRTAGVCARVRATIRTHVVSRPFTDSTFTHLDLYSVK